MKGLKSSLSVLRGLLTGGLSIRARLLLLSAFMLMLLAGSNLFLRSEIVAEQVALESNAANLKKINATLESGSQTLTEIGQAMNAGNQELAASTATTGSARGVRCPRS